MINFGKEKMENTTIKNYKKYRILFNSVEEEEMNFSEHYIKGLEDLKIKHYRKFLRLLYEIKNSSIYNELVILGEPKKSFDEPNNKIIFEFRAEADDSMSEIIDKSIINVFDGDVVMGDGTNLEPTIFVLTFYTYELDEMLEKAINFNKSDGVINKFNL